MSSKKPRSTAKMDPKDIEYMELIDACEFPASVDTDMLKGIHPDEWTNVGPSVVHFSSVILDMQNDNGKNLKHIQATLDRFVNYVVRYIKHTEGETYEQKNKTTREIVAIDKAVENRLKMAE
jgi:hypothetical protein